MRFLVLDSASGSLSLLTALTLREMKDEFEATVDLIGMPNEEARGDKIPMAQAGVFDGYDFVMMIHMNSNETNPSVHFLALSEMKVSFKGAPAHAAAETRYKSFLYYYKRRRSI
ncbi:MAG: hypothetical protein RR439_01245 [Carnobacterium sp.]